MIPTCMSVDQVVERKRIVAQSGVGNTIIYCSRSMFLDAAPDDGDHHSRTPSYGGWACFQRFQGKAATRFTHIYGPRRIADGRNLWRPTLSSDWSGNSSRRTCPSTAEARKQIGQWRPATKTSDCCRPCSRRQARKSQIIPPQVWFRGSQKCMYNREVCASQIAGKTCEGSSDRR